MCKKYESPQDLYGAVATSTTNLMRRTPATGWLPADQLSTGEAAKEILRLRDQITDLHEQLAAASRNPPTQTRHLAQGDEIFETRYTAILQCSRTQTTEIQDVAENTWDHLFAYLAPNMINEVSNFHLRAHFCNFIKASVQNAFPNRCKHLDPPWDQSQLGTVTVSRVHFQTALIQLRALGLITQSQRERSANDRNLYWTLTPYGDSVMVRLRAIPTKRRPDEAP